MTVGKVLPDGQLELPRHIREAAGLAPGDKVRVQVVGPGVVEIRILPRLSLDEALARYRIQEPIDEAAEDTLGSAHPWRTQTPRARSIPAFSSVGHATARPLGGLLQRPDALA